MQFFEYGYNSGYYKIISADLIENIYFQLRDNVNNEQDFIIKFNKKVTEFYKSKLDEEIKNHYFLKNETPLITENTKKMYFRCSHNGSKKWYTEEYYDSMFLHLPICSIIFFVPYKICMEKMEEINSNYENFEKQVCETELHKEYLKIALEKYNVFLKNKDNIKDIEEKFKKSITNLSSNFDAHEIIDKYFSNLQYNKRDSVKNPKFVKIKYHFKSKIQNYEEFSKFTQSVYDNHKFNSKYRNCMIVPDLYQVCQFLGLVILDYAIQAYGFYPNFEEILLLYESCTFKILPDDALLC